MKRLFIVVGVFLFCLLVSGRIAFAENKQTSLLPRASQVLAAFKASNGAALAKLVHPTLGVRFTPYAWDEIEGGQVLKPSEVAGLFTSKKKRNWGSYDGSGDPIILAPAAYVKRFVWNTDYTKVGAPEEVALPDLLKNDYAFIADGPAGEQIRSLYPQARVVVFYNPGNTGPEGGAMDWSRLLLIFVPSDSDWFLAGLVHDQWTI